MANNFFLLQSEFERMNCPNDHWIQSNINASYEVNNLLIINFDYI